MNLEHLKNKKRKTNNRLLAALPWCNLQKKFYKKQIFTRLNIFYELQHFLVIESVLLNRFCVVELQTESVNGESGTPAPPCSVITLQYYTMAAYSKPILIAQNPAGGGTRKRGAV